MKPADLHSASAADTAARRHDTVPPRAARPVLHAVGVVASGFLALLLLVCAVLPLLRMAGDVPHGFERQPVLSQAALPENRDPNLRVSSALVDLDDSYGSVAALRIPQVTKLRADRLAMPRILTGLATRALAPLERPPRLIRPA